MPLEMSRLGSTLVTGMAPANWLMASSMVCALAAQPAVPQQLWNSSRRRTTRRDWSVLSRLIFALMAAKATSGSASAKNGCCCVAEFDEWQRTQFALPALRTSAYSCEVAKVRLLVEDTAVVAVAGKPLLPPTSLMSGAISWIWVPAVAVAPAQFLIHTVSVSAQAAGDCSQQLWPPPTF